MDNYGAYDHVNCSYDQERTKSYLPIVCAPGGTHEYNSSLFADKKYSFSLRDKGNANDKYFRSSHEHSALMKTPDAEIDNSAADSYEVNDAVTPAHAVDTYYGERGVVEKKSHVVNSNGLFMFYVDFSPYNRSRIKWYYPEDLTSWES